MTMVAQTETKNCSECSKRIIGRSVRAGGTVVSYDGLHGRESSVIPGFAHPECASPRLLASLVCKDCFTIAPCSCA